MVLPLRRSNLRQMMEKGHLTFELKSEVLKQLKPIVSDSYCQKSNHGDLKVILLFVYY